LASVSRAESGFDSRQFLLAQLGVFDNLIMLAGLVLLRSPVGGRWRGSEAGLGKSIWTTQKRDPHRGRWKKPLRSLGWLREITDASISWVLQRHDEIRIPRRQGQRRGRRSA